MLRWRGPCIDGAGFQESDREKNSRTNGQRQGNHNPETRGADPVVAR